MQVRSMWETLVRGFASFETARQFHISHGCPSAVILSFTASFKRYYDIVIYDLVNHGWENKRHDPIEEIVSGSRSVASVTYLHCKENQWLAILFECTHNADFFLFSFSAAPFSPRFLAPRTIRWMIPTFSSC